MSSEYSVMYAIVSTPISCKLNYNQVGSDYYRNIFAYYRCYKLAEIDSLIARISCVSLSFTTETHRISEKYFATINQGPYYFHYFPN
jgi:hypothetical protein